MDQQAKQLLVETASAHVHHVQEQVVVAAEMMKTKAVELRTSYKVMNEDDRIIQERLIAHAQKKQHELEQMQPSPYFVRCDIQVGAKPSQPYYFSKFGFSDESIYSWVAPIATLRFESPGAAAFKRPDGTKQDCEITRRDQFVIHNGKITFLTTESTAAERELIYQEYFSNRKTGFMLSEIVERMEKAQDQVIRAPFLGPLMISGPAGSGKTTLALHRIAYLMQAPDTAELLRDQSILVFVQDVGTKDYFSHLLPELGITEVAITTYGEWALDVLGLENYSFARRYGCDEYERDVYEWEKLQALQSVSAERFSAHPFVLLEKVYEILSPASKKLLLQQKQEKILDRYDLTVLLRAYVASNGKLEMTRDYYTQQRSGALVKKQKKFPVAYGLLVVDEFQNYFSQQLNVINQCVSVATKSIVYVGDIGQQVMFGTVKELNDVNARLARDRMITLHKVYRNTKQILEFVRELGYDIEIPDGVSEGDVVAHMTFDSVEEEIAYVQNKLRDNDASSIGIIAENEEYLGAFRAALAHDTRVRIITVRESLGVEFDEVFVVGAQEFAREDYVGGDEKFSEQRTKISRDLLYVALTRAMRRLHYSGTLKSL